MAPWQRRARIGVGLFGLVLAVVVYAAIGERRPAAPIDRPARLDPAAIIESAGAAFRQFREATQDFSIEADRQLTYEGGATKFIGVTISVRNRGGRDFTVSGREAQAGENRQELDVEGDVTLTASDGLTVNADEATFRETDATVRVPGAVSFRRGSMSGSGRAMTYNQTTDVLTLAEEARVQVTDAGGQPQTEFTSGAATLARRERYLALEGNVHALRRGEVLEADRGVARLSADEEHITFIELRGRSRVAGGSALDSMRADEIDLDYSEDGATLERVALRGDAAVVLPEADGAAGRQFFGARLDLLLAADGSVTSATGGGGVRVVLPASGAAPARTIAAASFDAAGEPGRGLTAVRFTDAVEYREGEAEGRPARTARSERLQIGLAGAALTEAAFDGRVRFEQEDVRASGGQARYDPARGTLGLTGADAGGGPRLGTATIDIEAPRIDLTLDGIRAIAGGGVKTVLRQAPAREASAGPGTARLPGLLVEGQPVNINAAALDYRDASGRAEYSGGVALWQGETAVRADALALDRTRGDFVATGDARANLVLEAGASIGRAPVIRYEDAARRVVYDATPSPARTAAGAPAAAPAAPARAAAAPSAAASPPAASAAIPPAASATAPSAAGAPAPPPALAQLSGPQGDLRARRIDVQLAGAASRLERLEAYGEVTVRLDQRVGAGDRLTYYAGEERYVMTGAPTLPVRIVEECRETSGRTVTFFKSGDRVIVDGHDEVRTRSSRTGSCGDTPAR